MEGRIESGEVKLAAQRLPLWSLSLILAAGYIIFPIWFPLAPYVDAFPQLDIRSFTPSLTAGMAYLLLLLLLFAVTWLAFRWVLEQARPPGVGLLLLLGALFGLPLILTYPINATDIYRYFIQGRISVVHGANPLAVPASVFTNDPFFHLAGEWVRESSPYGPAWELVAALLTRLTPDGLLAGLIAFKCLALAAHLASGYLLWLILADQPPAQRAARTLLWAWNPALLLIFVVDGHNDILMLFWLLAGFWLLQRDHPVAGMAVMVLAPLTKLIGLLPLPFFFIWAWRRLPDRRRRWQFALWSGVAMGGLATLLFLPFGSPFDLLQRLIREASLGGGFSPILLLVLTARELAVNLDVEKIGWLASGIFALLVCRLVWWTWRGRSPLLGAAEALGGYLLQALNYRIWYAAWLFPWLLLDGRRAPQQDPRLLAGLTFLFTSQISVLIYGHLRVYALGGDHMLAHLIGVPFTFGMPLLIASQVGKRTSTRFKAGVTGGAAG